LLLLNLLVRL
jgi:hypothetical protein